MPMGGFDDHVAIMGEWMPPSPNPGAFFLSMMNDDVGARLAVESDSGNRRGPEQQGTSRNGDQKDQSEASFGDDETNNCKAAGEPKLSSRGGLMERIAARAGFNAPRLNTENIRPSDLSKKPEVRSPYLTIPPGLSPTTLLDSPVFLSNSLVLPSPTTGKFSFASSGDYRDSTLMIGDSDKGKENNFEDINASSFAFKPITESASFPYLNATNKTFPSAGFTVHSNTSLQRQSIEPTKSHLANNSTLFQEASFSKSDLGNNGSSNLLQQTHSSGAMAHSPPFDEQNDDGDQRSSGDPNSGGSTADDGYNWRKYGQKHVKGSEYPRSYYKCTHPSCPVKKKVERSQEGHITEIIYKGAHNHAKPPPNRRSTLGSSNALGDMQLDAEEPGTGDPIWSAVQNGNAAGGWKPDNLETTPSALPGQEYNNGGTTAPQAQNGTTYESVDGVDGCSTFSNEEEEDDRATRGSMSLGYDGEGDESESKRRKLETYAPEMGGASRPIREPRVVVQTTSEVDILDDGYRWRKYGQKVVKGNPNPRSYYKCTSAGCNVRKHVERASHDLKSVITTYEGKHNHDVPAARNSGAHVNSGGQNTHPPQQAHAASGNVHRPEPSHLRGSTAWFERPALGSFGLGPGHGFGYRMDQAGLGMGPNQGKLGVHPYLGQQNRAVKEMCYMLPKGEPKVEPVTDAGGLNSSNASSVYEQLMSRLPHM
ncbi:probable WRKY transcription factor 2 isoform X2 [Salvia miltiorrhiza]|uniref:WRKY protein n=2 Tax=Salvia miltiorrhiza TaxID=226208 RepID=A0A0D5YAF4_SALMI|nr:probable WRKY transcription factor 2 isoform X2 [Salvia miltiorrhiza]AKA27908.1 WRKY protein [Salvia miltiorrhiza]AVV65753.1 WRKY42 transcription factor [Salvia miltiorrhiza]